MSNRSDTIEHEGIFRLGRDPFHIHCYDFWETLHQSLTYLGNNEETEKLKNVKEFNTDAFLKIASNSKTYFRKFKKPDNSTIADIVWRLYNEIPASYGVLTNGGVVDFGKKVIVSLANSIQDKVKYTDVKQIDVKTLSKSIGEYAEDTSIFFLSVDDIDGMRLDWIGCIEKAIDRFELQYVIIEDLSLIYRPQIYPKLVLLARESKVDIIAFVNR